MLQRKAYASMKLIWCFFGILGALALTGCGGEDKIRDFVDIPDVTLSNLEVVEGGELRVNDNPIYDFNPNNTGPYEIELTSDEVTQVTLVATLSDAENNILKYVRVAQGENSREEIIVGTSGQPTTFDLISGTNLIYARVENIHEEAVSNYAISAYRLSESSQLKNMYVAGNDLRYYSSFDGIDLVSPSANFDPEILEYNIDVDAVRCGVSLQSHPQSRRANVAVDGVAQQLFQSTFVPLLPGEVREVNVDVTSENGESTTRYTLKLARKTLSSDEQEAERRIQSVEFAQGRAIQAFRCDVNQFAQLYSNADTDISFIPTLAGPNATMTIGNAIVDEDGVFEMDEDDANQWASENDEALVSGEAYAGALFDNLEVGDNFFVIRVTSANDNSATYLFNAVKSATRTVFVNTGSELQKALKNAQPNDEIILLKGEYTGAVGEGEDFSGHATAHFYSNASGLPATDDDDAKPIILRALTSGVILSSDDQSQYDLFRLEGDYWQIRGFSLTGAQNAMVLDGADHNFIRDLSINAVGERGIVVQNGSDQNAIRNVRINRTGRSPQTREGIDEVYGEAIVIGGGEESSIGNALRYVLFGENMAGEALDIKANAVDTDVEFNSFVANNVAPGADRVWVNIDGSGEMNFTYNEFDYTHYTSGTEPIIDVVHVGSADAQIEFLQNRFDLDDQPAPMLTLSGNASVYAAGNLRRDSIAGSYVGAVDQSFAMPVYQIESTLTEGKCLAQKDYDMSYEEQTVANEIVLMADCANEPGQRWQITHDRLGSVFLIPENMSNFKLAPGKPLEPISGITGADVNVISVREDAEEAPLSYFNDSFSLRWFMFFEGDQVSFINKGDSTYLTEIDLDWSDTDYSVNTEDNPLTTQTLGTGSSQVFKLKRLEN